MKMKKIFTTGLATCLILLSMPTATMAHGVWLETRLDKTTLVLGEGYKDNAYDPDMVTSLKAYDENYIKTTIKKTKYSDHITVTPSDKTAVVVTEFDYGYWSKDPKTGEFKNVPMTELKGSTVGTHAIKYSVSYLSSVKKVKEIPNIPYQLIPQTDPTKLSVGDTLKVKVVNNGKAMANVDVILDVANNHTVTSKTDKNGFVSVPIENGAINVIGIELTLPYTSDDAKASQLKVFSSLSFTLYPEEDE